MAGAPSRPHKLVTHNWSNLFHFLVSAIIADALGEEEYSRIEVLLEHDIDSVEHLLKLSGGLQRTYWVCAFCVNQHMTICDANPLQVRDTCTQELYPLCGCG